MWWKKNFRHLSSQLSEALTAPPGVTPGVCGPQFEKHWLRPFLHVNMLYYKIFHCVPGCMFGVIVLREGELSPRDSSSLIHSSVQSTVAMTTKSNILYICAANAGCFYWQVEIFLKWNKRKDLSFIKDVCWLLKSVQMTKNISNFHKICLKRFFFKRNSPTIFILNEI